MNPEAVPWVAVLVTQSRRRTGRGQRGCCVSARVKGDLGSEYSEIGWLRPPDGDIPSPMVTSTRALSCLLGVPALVPMGQHLASESLGWKEPPC